LTVYSPLLHSVKEEIGNIKDDTQEIKELTSEIRNSQMGNLPLKCLTK